MKMLKFGKVIKYLDKGFGFIKPIDKTHDLNEKEIFFHVSVVKDYESDLEGLSKGNVDSLYFWFTVKNGKKGVEVTNFWDDPKEIPHDLCSSILEKYSASLIALEHPAEPVNKHMNLNRISVAAVDKNNFSAKNLATKYLLDQVKSEELLLLIKDMKDRCFTFSAELSNYITSNKLGYKYPNIAGTLTMTNDSREWDLDGGFPSDIYRIVCKELKLIDKGTSARPVGFKSYQNSKVDLDLPF